jgi:hypothetical protein
LTEPHHEIEELLAGYSLRALSGPDAEEAERLLVSHIPDCSSCRATLEAFDAVAADLALATPALAPPETLLPRLHREMGVTRRREFDGSRLGQIAAVAAGLVLVVAVGGAVLTRGGSDPSLAAADLSAALEAAESPDAQTTAIGPATEVDPADTDDVYVYGTSVGQPPSGWEFRVWLVVGDSYDYLGDFVPEANGSFALRITDAGEFDQILITVEPVDSEPSSPGEPAWAAAAWAA